MSNVVAGIGRGQLLHLEEHKAGKTRVYKKYEEAFKGLPLTMNPYIEDTDPNFWLSCILLDETVKITPMDILNRLNEENIERRFCDIKLPHERLMLLRVSLSNLKLSRASKKRASFLSASSSSTFV